MPLLSESAARPIPAVTALRFLSGLVDNPASVALRLRAIFIKNRFGGKIVDGAEEKEDTAASADCSNVRADEVAWCV